MSNALRYHLRRYGLLEIALRHPTLLARVLPSNGIGSLVAPAWLAASR